MDFLGGTTATLDTLTNASDAVVDFVGNAGIAGFVFHVAKDTTAEFENDITDHFIEDGTTVQDMIAYKPVRLTLTGFVGEFKNIVKDEKSTLQKASEKLTQVTSYAKTVSAFAKQIPAVVDSWNNGDYLDAMVDGGTSLYGTYKDLNPSKSEQVKAFIFFEALRARGTTLKVSTPWKNYENMVIETLIAKQDETTNDITDFEVKLKQIRYVKTINKAKQQSLQGRMKSMLAEAKQKGADACEKVGFSSLANYLKK